MNTVRGKCALTEMGISERPSESSPSANPPKKDNVPNVGHAFEFLLADSVEL